MADVDEQSRRVVNNPASAGGVGEAGEGARALEGESGFNEFESGVEDLIGAEATFRGAKSAPEVVSKSVRGDGERLGEWVVKDKLQGGGGGEAELFHVRHRQDRRMGVMKVYRENIRPDVDLLEHLLAEEISGVVRVWEHGVAGAESDFSGRYYEVMEECEGHLGSPKYQSAAGREEWVLELVRQVGEALGAIQKADIVHRDIKPSNILIRKSEPVEFAVADFGIAAFAGRGVRAGKKEFSYRYASPSQLAAGTVDKADDWWSLGMMVCELLRQQHPFGREGKDQVLAEYVNRRWRPQAPPVVSPRWQELLDGLMNYDADRRWGHGETTAWCRQGLKEKAASEIGRAHV